MYGSSVPLQRDRRPSNMSRNWGQAAITAQQCRLMRWEPMSHRLLATILLAIAALPGCAVKKLAINKLGDALASPGTTFSADNDPAFIRDAVPFSLKLMESLLAESPRHRGLLLASASGFTQYAYAF